MTRAFLELLECHIDADARVPDSGSEALVECVCARVEAMRSMYQALLDGQVTLLGSLGLLGLL